MAPNKTKSSRRPIRWKHAFWLFGLVLLLWLGLKTWRIGQAAQSLLAQQTAVETLLADGLTNINPDEAESIVGTVRQDFVVLRDETAFLMPLTPHLGWIPKVGPLLLAAPQLVEMGDAGTETAVYAVAGLKPVLLILQADDADTAVLPQLINALANARPDLAKAAVSLDRVAAARAEISNVSDFPERLQPLFAQADEWLPIAQDSLAVVPILPEIMGINGRRTYLLLAQNEDELRATGGFISGVGTLTVENGDIQSLTFQDASTFDTQTLLADSSLYDYPPQPLYELMGLEYLLLRDANYWPDFPYSAQTAIELYERVEPFPALDGVIAIDQEFMSLLVAATGPVKIPESNTTITADNTVESFRNAFNIREGQTVQDWLQNRKSFLLTFATAVLDKVQSDFGSVDSVAFTRNIHSALNSRHLQLYMVNPQETAVLDQLDWDGRLQNLPDQDFLLVLDTNMGFNKSNMHVTRSIHYDVSVDTAGTATANLTVSYAYAQIPGETPPCEQEISYASAPSYQEIANRCYFNYLRIYSPADAILQNATQNYIPGEVLISGLPWNDSAQTVSEFANFTTFTNFMMLPQGETAETSFSYQLPATVIRTENGENTYQLLLRQQAGTLGDPISVTLRLPTGSSITYANSSQEARIIPSENEVEFSLNLQTDTLLTVVFENNTNNE